MHDILVHAVRYRDRDPTASYAARLAASLRASLTAVYVPPAMPAIPEYDVAAVIAEYAAWIERETRQARAAGPGFEAWSASLGVAHARWEVADGQVAAVLRHAGRWHDLLVLGTGSEDAWQSEAGVSELVLATGLPCLVVPPAANDCALPHACIAVAWNGAAEAIAALHAALPLLQSARRVVVLSGEAAPAAPGLVPFDIDAWARCHQVEVEYLAMDRDEDVGAALLAAAGEVSADLLVAGAYGRSRLAEWALGGVTRHLIRHATIPLLLRH